VRGKGCHEVATTYESDSERRPLRSADLGALSGAQLARLLLDRDPAAHAYVFREWSSAVRRASYRVLRSRDQVDDVVQRVFEELWKCPERFDPIRGSIDQYLSLQGRSRSIDHLRAEVSRARREGIDGAAHVSAGSFDEEGNMGHWLECLPTGEREVIQLAYVRQLTYQEVAIHLDLPPGTVKSRIRAGLLRLRLVISNEDDAEAVDSLLVDP
jgi:RNA polymerase sigma-70 factor (ECF subfamily)